MHRPYTGNDLGPERMSEERKSLGNSKGDAIAPVLPSKLALPAGYGPLLASLKEQIETIYLNPEPTVEVRLLDAA